MKKLLGILVLGLLWCNVSTAAVITFECKNTQKNDAWTSPEDLEYLIYEIDTSSYDVIMKWKFKDKDPQKIKAITKGIKGTKIIFSSNRKKPDKNIQSFDYTQGSNGLPFKYEQSYLCQKIKQIGVIEKAKYEEKDFIWPSIYNWVSTLPDCDPPVNYDFKHKLKNCYGTDIYSLAGETNKYVGEYNQFGKWHGKGTLCYQNGNRWEGEFNGGGQSRGTIIWADGTYWEGVWKSNKPINVKRRSDGTLIDEKKIPADFVYKGVCNEPWSLKPEIAKEKSNEPKYCNLNRHLFCSAQRQLDICSTITNSSTFNSCMKGVENIGRTLQGSYGLSSNQVTLGMAKCDCY